MVQAWELSAQETETGTQSRVLRQTGVTQLKCQASQGHILGTLVKQTKQ